MGTGASVPAPPTSWSTCRDLTQEEYIKEHQKYYEAFTNTRWAEAYQSVASQTSAGALAALGETNYQNCIRFAVGAIGHSQGSPRDVEEAVAVLCRSVEVAKWRATKAASFVMDHPKRTLVLEGFMKALFPEFAAKGPEAQADLLLGVIDGDSKSLGAVVLSVTRACIADGLEEKALGLLEKYLKLHKAPDAYDAGDLLALWYALQWRKSGKKPNVVGKVALVLLKSSHMKVVVDDEGTELDAGVTSWDKDILKTVTVPDVMRDWRLFSDAMCFLNDSTGSTFSVGFEPILVEDCWEVLTKAQNPLWDSKYKRCISHTDFGTPEFMSALQKWEEGYVKEKGGDSDVLAFHLLFPAGRPCEAKVPITVGGIATGTINHRAFKGRPAYQATQTLALIRLSQRTGRESSAPSNGIAERRMSQVSQGPMSDETC